MKRALSDAWYLTGVILIVGASVIIGSALFTWIAR